MCWTIKEKARYLARVAMRAVKEGTNLEAVIEGALKKIAENEKGSGESGL